MDVAAAGRDDAGRDAAAETERVADGDDPVADLRRAAVAELDVGQRLVGIDLQYGDVGARVAADQRAVYLLLSCRITSTLAASPATWLLVTM